MGFGRGLSTVGCCTGLSFALGFANQALIARGLGPQGRGALMAVATAVMLGSLVFGEWLARGNTDRAGREPQRRGPLWANTLAFGAALLLALLAGVAVAIAVALPRVAAPASHWLLAAALVAVAVVQRGALAILLGCDRLTAYALVPVLFALAYLGLNGVALGALGAGVAGVLVAWLAAAAAATAVAAALSRSPGRPDVALLRATAVVGTRGAVSTTAIFLLFRSDVWLVLYFLGEGPLGVYSIAVVVAEMIQRLPNAAGTVLLPKVIGGGDDDHALSLAVGRNVLLFSLAAAALVVVAGQQLIEAAFGADYAGAYGPLVWMLPGLVASGLGSVLNTKLAGQGYPPATLWAPALALAVNVGLNLYLIPARGLTGAALATSVAYALWATLIAAAYRRATGATWADLARRSPPPALPG